MIHRRYRQLARTSERGSIMFITVGGMTVVLAMGSFAIDTARWYQKHHQTQLAADAAALAAANCIADAGSPGDTCTSTTDTTDAAQAAIAVAADNGLTIASSNVSFSGSNVSVSASMNVGSLFAELFKISGAHPTANAGAAWTTSARCTSAGPSCYAIFAYNAACNTGGSTVVGAPGVTNNGNSVTANGGVHSNGNIYNNGNNGNATFPDYSTWGSDCPSADNASPGTNASAGSSSLPYPLDFSGLSPAADNNDVAPPDCTYTAGVSEPVSGVTYSSSSETLTISGSAPSNVYCNPSGTIDITGSSASGGFTTSGGDTYIARAITGINTANNLQLRSYDSESHPNPWHLLIYQTSPSWNGVTCSSIDPNVVDIGGNSKDVFDGVIFAPCGTIQQTANNTTSDMFLEGYNVNLQGNAFTGVGPASGETGGQLAGTDSLTQ